MAYRIVFERVVLTKDAPALDKNTLRGIRDILDTKLREHPDVFGKPLRHALKNHCALRVGNYQVVYRLDVDTVRIIAIIHRSRGHGDIASRV